MTRPGLSRRHALGGAAVVGVGLPVLSACGGDSTAEGSAATSGGGESSASDEPQAEAGAVLGSTADVEVGGGAIYAKERVVVTQPAEGEFRAFSSTCTHQGCQVNSVADGQIACPCHGSHFSIEDGSVVAGPAPRPLSPVEITVEGDEITVG